jgi:hypothetical protein
MQNKNHEIKVFNCIDKYHFNIKNSLIRKYFYIPSRRKRRFFSFFLKHFCLTYSRTSSFFSQYLPHRFCRLHHNLFSSRLYIEFIFILKEKKTDVENLRKKKRKRFTHLKSHPF